MVAIEQGSAVRDAHLPDLRAKKSRSTTSSPIFACNRSISCTRSGEIPLPLSKAGLCSNYANGPNSRIRFTGHRR